jgi:hypothetical protein
MEDSINHSNFFYSKETWDDYAGNLERVSTREVLDKAQTEHWNADLVQSHRLGDDREQFPVWKISSFDQSWSLVQCDI